MPVLKLVDVSQIQAGDSVVFNNTRYTCEYVENDGIAFDLQLHDWQGNKFHKILTAGESVSIQV